MFGEQPRLNQVVNKCSFLNTTNPNIYIFSFLEEYLLSSKGQIVLKEKKRKKTVKENFFLDFYVKKMPCAFNLDSISCFCCKHIDKSNKCA